MINHISCLNSVMLIEIPDPEMILSVGVAFGVGILGLFVWSKFRSVSASKPDKSEDSERLEYYERQLIDMKIRLDAIDMEHITFKSNPQLNSNDQIPQIQAQNQGFQAQNQGFQAQNSQAQTMSNYAQQEIMQNPSQNPSFQVQNPQNELQNQQIQPQNSQAPPEQYQESHIENHAGRQPNLGFDTVVEKVLGLITTRSMTSRDIQMTLGRSREHTSRLMNRLYKDGLVDRNTNSKPFSYIITEKGREKIGSGQTVKPETA